MYRSTHTHNLFLPGACASTYTLLQKCLSASLNQLSTSHSANTTQHMILIYGCHSCVYLEIMACIHSIHKYIILENYERRKDLCLLLPFTSRRCSMENSMMPCAPYNIYSLPYHLYHHFIRVRDGWGRNYKRFRHQSLMCSSQSSVEMMYIPHLAC